MTTINEEKEIKVNFKSELQGKIKRAEVTREYLCTKCGDDVVQLEKNKSFGKCQGCKSISKMEACLYLTCDLEVVNEDGSSKNCEITIEKILELIKKPDCHGMTDDDIAMEILMAESFDN